MFAGDTCVVFRQTHRLVCVCVCVCVAMRATQPDPTSGLRDNYHV